MKKLSCRILVGLKCNFSCSYCCNDTMPELMRKFEPLSFDNVQGVVGAYQNVVISGGEPLVPANLSRTLDITQIAKNARKNVYIYTNLSWLPDDESMEKLIQTDGWSVGVHRQSVDLVENLERLIGLGGRNIRIHVEKTEAKHYVDLVDHLNVNIKPYTMNDCDISDREDWYILEGD